MVKAVFTTKVTPAYDDLPEIRYHFPRTYLAQARAAVGDWIVYYEPRRSTAEPSSRGGRQAYFAVARALSVEPDPNLPDHYYAHVSDYLELIARCRFGRARSPESRWADQPRQRRTR
jgi:putative restriction endonuclease